MASSLADDNAAATSAERKSVHFRLKHNLHFAYGGALLFRIVTWFHLYECIAHAVDTQPECLQGQCLHQRSEHRQEPGPR